MPLPGHSGHHAVQFHSDSARLCVSVADFLGDGIAAGQPIIVIATPEHRKTIVSELTRRHFDVERLRRAGDLALMDAQEMLDTFMFGDVPQPRLFREAVGIVIDSVCNGRAECVVRAYGEMVDLLWQAGKCEAATRLEVLWNNLAADYHFSLLCGYSMGHFYKQPAAMKEVCGLHTHAEILDRPSAG
jgi:hypothetical protein